MSVDDSPIVSMASMTSFKAIQIASVPIARPNLHLLRYRIKVGYCVRRDIKPQSSLLLQPSLWKLRPTGWLTTRVTRGCRGKTIG